YTDERPVSAVVVAAELELLLAVGHSNHFSHATTGLNKAAEPSIKKLIHGATKFHTTWICRKVLLKAHLSNSDLFVNVYTIHIFSPKISYIVLYDLRYRTG